MGDDIAVERAAREPGCGDTGRRSGCVARSRVLELGAHGVTAAVAGRFSPTASLHRTLRLDDITFFDISICDPRTQDAMTAPTPSSEQGGVAAELRAREKVKKYAEAASRMGGSGFAATIGERTGALSDGFVNLIKHFTGEGDRDSLLSQDYTFSASSRTTYVAQRIVFALVMADAWMVIQNAMTDTRGAPVGARPSSDAGARVAFAAYIGHPLDGGARRK